MSAKDTIYQAELDLFKKTDELRLCAGIEIARLHRMNLSEFKKIINQNISTENDEDQWAFDYESYLLSISIGYEDPVNWGKGFYQERWIS